MWSGTGSEAGECWRSIAQFKKQNISDEQERCSDITYQKYQRKQKPCITRGHQDYLGYPKKGDGKKRLAGVRAGLYEHTKHEVRKRTVQAEEPMDKDR